MDFFRSGSQVLAVGDTSVTLTGLALPFTPTQVVVSVRQPAAESGLVSAYAVGTPTADGFSAALSAPIPAAGYILDWCVTSDAMQSVAGDSLAADYTQLKDSVADFLGFDPANLTEGQANKVNSYIRSGLRQFYYPPKMDGVDENFEWSFLRMSGEVTTAANVGDYILANGFGRVSGSIFFGGEDTPRIPLAVVSLADLLVARRTGAKGAPRLAAFRFSDTFGTRGQRVEMLLHPVPDREYALSLVGEADTGMLDAERRPFPLGGARFSELVMESCLAIAEQRANDEIGEHTTKFQQLLVAAIAKDRKASGAVFGQMGDRPGLPPDVALPRPHHRGETFPITYRGETW